MTSNRVSVKDFNFGQWKVYVQRLPFCTDIYITIERKSDGAMVVLCNKDDKVFTTHGAVFI